MSKEYDTPTNPSRNPTYISPSNDYQTYLNPSTNFAQSHAYDANHTAAYGLSSQARSNSTSRVGHSISRVGNSTSRLVSSQVKNEEVVQGNSRISYVPYEKKVVEYEDRRVVEKVPIKRKVVTYQERKVVETIPREVVKQDYYAVEHKIEYIKEIVPERYIQYVPVEKKIKRYEYVPIEKQVIHYPENVDLETAKNQSRMVLGKQGFNIQSNAEFKQINPALIYNYSDRPQSKNNPIGYFDEGHHRNFSNAPTYSEQTFVSPPVPTYPQYQTEYHQPAGYQMGYHTGEQTRYSPSGRLSGSGAGQYQNSINHETSYIHNLNTGSRKQLQQPFKRIQQFNSVNNNLNQQSPKKEYDEYGLRQNIQSSNQKKQYAKVESHYWQK